jgi:DNA-binding winged helix-turn-helix (wHTH) protein
VKLSLGDGIFDSERRQLLRGPDEVHLSPKAFDLLTLLIAARPRALAKAELQEQLWPATFVAEANLASLVAEIRRALGDTAGRPRFIRTAHRYGYAFCFETPLLTSDGHDELPSPFCWLLRNGRRLTLRAGENILGREALDGIRLDSPTVSRRHARITVTGDAALVDDLGSKNGTFLRGSRLTAQTRLGDGDEIRVGSVVLRFRITSGSSTATWSGVKRRRKRVRRSAGE